MSNMFRLGKISDYLARTVSPRDFLDSFEAVHAGSPITADYRRYSEPFLFRVRLDHCRAFPRFSLGGNGNHPLIQVLRNLPSPESDKALFIHALRMGLEDFYLTNRPEVPEDIFSDKISLSFPQSQYPWQLVLPWQRHNLSEWTEITKRSAKRESGGKLSIEDGWTWCGPVSEGKLSLEVKRFGKLFRSLSTRGYEIPKSAHGHVKATALVSGAGEIRWQGIAGLHRLLVLSALGVEEVIVRVHQVVRFAEAEFWPRVVDSTYSGDSARKMFGVVHSGE